MKIIEEWQRGENEFAFDTQWDRFLLEMSEQEFATYSVNFTTSSQKVIFTGIAQSGTLVIVTQNGSNGSKKEITKTGEFEFTVDLLEADKVEVRIEVLSGQIKLRKVDFR